MQTRKLYFYLSLLDQGQVLKNQYQAEHTCLQTRSIL